MTVHYSFIIILLSAIWTALMLCLSKLNQIVELLQVLK